MVSPELHQCRLRIVQFDFDNFRCLFDFADHPRFDGALDALQQPGSGVPFEALNVEVEEIANVGARHIRKPREHFVGAHGRS